MFRDSTSSKSVSTLTSDDAYIAVAGRVEQSETTSFAWCTCISGTDAYIALAVTQLHMPSVDISSVFDSCYY